MEAREQRFVLHLHTNHRRLPPKMMAGLPCPYNKKEGLTNVSPFDS
jgi:hypothetical protein